jgi:hypothetical protein
MLRRPRNPHALECGIILLAVQLAACAGRDWKVQTFATPVSADSAFSASKRALATIGQVTYADASTRSVTGECQANVIAAIAIEAVADATLVHVKSKMNVAPNIVGGEFGKRQHCIDAIAAGLKTSGVSLAPRPESP